MHGPVVRFQRHDERFSHGCTTVLAGDDGSTVPNVLTVHGERKAEIRPGPKIRYAEASAAVSIGPPPVGDGGVPVEAHRLLALSPYPYDEHWVGEKFASENGGVTPSSNSGSTYAVASPSSFISLQGLCRDKTPQSSAIPVTRKRQVHLQEAR